MYSHDHHQFVGTTGRPLPSHCQTTCRWYWDFLGSMSGKALCMPIDLPNIWLTKLLSKQVNYHHVVCNQVYFWWNIHGCLPALGDYSLSVCREFCCTSAVDCENHWIRPSPNWRLFRFPCRPGFLSKQLITLGSKRMKYGLVAKRFGRIKAIV